MKVFLKITISLLAGFVILVLLVLAFLWLDSMRDMNAYFDLRKGDLVSASVSPSAEASPGTDGLITLTSDTGLAVTLRVLRATDSGQQLPVLLVLGGHRTGSQAVHLVGDPRQFAVVVMDYPYDGPPSIRGFVQTLRYLPRIRRALLDIPPAVSLVVDWLQRQSWADKDRVVMLGVSLGVPFAAAAAARDKRLGALWLVHGAADNHLWLRANIARRIQSKNLQSLATTVLMWIAHGPSFDTAARVAEISPRPVLIVGARADERTPAGQTEMLYAAAREPKSLRWTEGQHIEPNREGVLRGLLEIAREQLATDESHD